jgi:hypothetical protein
VYVYVYVYVYVAFNPLLVHNNGGAAPRRVLDASGVFTMLQLLFLRALMRTRFFREMRCGVVRFLCRALERR